MTSVIYLASFLYTHHTPQIQRISCDIVAAQMGLGLPLVYKPLTKQSCCIPKGSLDLVQ